MLSSFSAEFLSPYILVESDKIGCLLRPWFGPFGQFEQMVLDDGSPLWSEKPDVIWIALRIVDVDRRLLDEYPALRPEEAMARVASLRDRVVVLARAARERFKGPILVSNLTVLDQGPIDVFDASDPAGAIHVIAEQNKGLAAELASSRRCPRFRLSFLRGGRRRRSLVR